MCANAEAGEVEDRHRMAVLIGDEAIAEDARGFGLLAGCRRQCGGKQGAPRDLRRGHS